ncbi:mitochondrial protein C2orf69 homolog isoform X2 [Rhynchophorus ferrugineus]|uniref:Uncharacterized protein n=1 Tax=Rhynchophorus ferrugineus TaxID=354439 RepID=A0A834MKM6_RHYFE|nr:hypothetical protein GWI33_009814 [Rhynchophorus ferrugineus]
MSNNVLKLNYPIRISAIRGFENRANDIVYCQPLSGKECPEAVVLFPGDVQDYTENMLAHRDNKNHKDWSLDNTAFRMQQKFPKCHILVVKPSRMDFKTFSCFKNFVESDNLGVPHHTANYNSLTHLDKLIQNVSSWLNDLSQMELNDLLSVSKKAVTCMSNDDVMNHEDSASNYHKNIRDCNLKLVGFSKGCVVLNQMLHEFHTVMNSHINEDYTSFISRISDMYWLDGGHSGGKNTWITDKDILQTLALLEIKVHIHLSPYQIEDDRRPWIRKEEKIFSDVLKRLGCNIQRYIHFEGLPSSIMLHFNVYDAFKPV